MSDLRMELIHGQLKDIEENVRSIKATWGNTITTLDNIKTSLKADRQKAIDEAYHKGFEAGQHEATTLEYQQGLDDAWEAAKKLFSEMSNTEINLVFPQEWNSGGFKALMALHPQDAIDRIKAYEEQQKADAEDSEIRVGDEVKHKNGNVRWTSVVVKIDGDTIYLMGDTGAVADYQRCNFKKTGRHFPQVAELLKAMKEGAD